MSTKLSGARLLFSTIAPSASMLTTFKTLGEVRVTINTNRRNARSGRLTTMLNQSNKQVAL
jgi:hypothetical protein